jgi:shikimate dehydrogenase
VKLENPNLRVRAVPLGEERAEDYDVIVNCAPPAADATHLNLSMAGKQTLVVDIVLKPAWTPLLAEAKAQGLKTHEGIHMLSGQLKALLAFFRLPH